MHPRPERPPLHRLLIQPGQLKAGPVRIEGDEAAHAVRVKRVREGERVGLLDGRGGVGEGRVVSADARGRWIEVDVVSMATLARTAPTLHVWTATPKGDRMLSMLDGLAQVGAASWTPMRCARSAAHPTPARMNRAARVAGEVGKQCGRAWTMEIRDEDDFERALDADGVAVLLADASGEDMPEFTPQATRLLVGPEGGWTDDELERAMASGARVIRLGAHVMRVETAAVAVSAVLMRHARAGAQE